MEDELCGTMWSTYEEKKGKFVNGRRHACRFPKNHRGNICMCPCGQPHRNLDREEAKKQEQESVSAAV